MNTLEIIGMQCIVGTASDMLFKAVAIKINCCGVSITRFGQVSPIVIVQVLL